MIRPAELADLDQLVEIEKRFGPDACTRRQLRHLLRSPTVLFDVYALGPKVVGHSIVTLREGSYHARLYGLATAKGYEGRGVATKLLRQALLFSGQLGVGMSLEVRFRNRRAIRLYERHGFSKVGVRKNYYHDGANAWRMRRPANKDLSHVS